MIQRPLRFGALFAGYGGLEDGVQSVIGGVLAWYSEHEPPSEKNPRPSQAAARIMEYHHPGVPNLGDITQIDWHKAAPVDVLTGGSPCFAAGTPVLTRRGLIPIEGVDVGDHVWTHEARWRPVTATMVRDAPTVEFRPGFYSTPDHRFWLRTPGRVWNNSRRAYDRTLGEPEWIPAELSQGHYAATPARVTGVRHDKPSSLTWWQIGRFLADGYNSHQVNVYLGAGKLADTARFPGWKQIQQETALKLTMPKSAAEVAWLNEHFGKGAHGKTLPAFALALPEPERRELISGYWSGDGYAFGKRSMRSASVSPGLTIGIEMLAASLGYSTSLHYNRTAPTTEIQGRTVNQRNWWSTTATPDEGRYTERGADWMWHKLRKQPSDGEVQPVYDLTVAEDHSFIAAGIVVHNCQDVSTAGKRAGMRAGTRSGLWASMCDAIDILRPELVVWENVRGAHSSEADSSLEPCPGCVGDRDDGPVLRALGRVLGDLAELGYDAWWCGIRASDVGAPHGRYRVFVFATPADAEDVGHERGRGTRPGRTGPENGGDAPADASRIGWDQWRPESAGIVRGLDAPERGSPHAPDADSDAVRVESVALAGSSGAPEPGWHGEAPADSDDDGLTRLGRVHAGERDPDGRGREGPTRDDAEPTAWGPYAPAIDRWAAALGRPAPPPTELGPKGAPRLSSRFVEWLMGLPAGHVTDVPGISRIDQLKALGNGVVPAQAAAATRRWLNHYANA